MSRTSFPLVLILLFALLMLTACGATGAGNDNTAVSSPQPSDLPTLLPTAVLTAPDETDSSPEEDNPDSPREADNNTGLPPTFTPVPAIERATPSPSNTLVPIAPANPSDAPPATGQTYTVEPGDTLAVIAAELGVPLDRLITVNDITDPDRIEVGDVLLIPTD